MQLDVLSCFSDLLQATFADDVVEDAEDTDMTLPPVPTPLRFRQLSGARHVEVGAMVFVSRWRVDPATELTRWLQQARMSDVVEAVTTQLRRPSLAIVARIKFWKIMTQLATVVREGRRADMARCLNENALVSTALVSGARVPACRSDGLRRWLTRALRGWDRPMCPADWTTR